jgi:lipopolysaccharide biosynthesis protein
VSRPVTYTDQAVSQILARDLELALSIIDRLEVQIESLEGKLDRHARKFEAKLDRQARKFEAKLDRQARKSTLLKKEVKKLKAELSGVYESSWWRMAAPFRAAPHFATWTGRRARQALGLTWQFLTEMRHPIKEQQSLLSLSKEGNQIELNSTIGTAVSSQACNAYAFETTYKQTFVANNVKDTAIYCELAERPVPVEFCDVKLIAYYLPQFHPIPENDEWWGRGFTEWQNVTKAAPVFVGHYQPKLPGELGFYDLRVVDVIRRQAELARLYGISAFCFHFYWFGGKRLLEAPLLSFLDNTDIDMKFCLCWANENWTRRWDGSEDEMLIGQRHSPEDDIAFLRYLKKYFDDPRYMKIEGKPILTVYRPGILPDAGATASRWRIEAMAMGLPGLCLVATNSFGFSNPADIDFDVLSEFPPHNAFGEACEVEFLTNGFYGNVRSYSAFLKGSRRPERAEMRTWPGVMPSWDNTARNPVIGTVYHGSTPGLFRKWLDRAIIRARRNSPGDRFILVNAWNEWAEGAYLEPDRRFGYAYLGACASSIRDNTPANERVRALLAETRERFRAHFPLACALHLYYEDMADELACRIGEFADLDIYLTVPKDISYETAEHLVEVFPNAYILEVENRGRDILPFLTISEILQTGNHRFICKLHTKRSAHLADGGVWREELVASLLSPAAHDALREAEANSSIGILAGKGSLASLAKEEVRRNSVSRIHSIAAKTGIEVTFSEPFVAGSMFWFRPEAMLLFFRLACAEDFEPELGQIDGTMAHALERMTIIAARASGFETVEIEGETTPRQY